MPTTKRISKAVTDPRTGKRIYFKAKNERELNQKILAWAGRGNKEKTFEYIADEWYTEAEKTISVQTVDGYRRGCEYAKQFFGKKDVAEISSPEISRYLQSLCAKGLSRKSIANMKGVLSLIFKFAWVTKGYIQFNPVLGVPLPKAAPAGKRVSATTEDEQKILEDRGRTWLFPYIALLTGMRKGEILALEWENIDLERRLISVVQSLAFDNGKGFLKTPKTETGYRAVPICNELLTVLKENQGEGLLFPYNGGLYNDRHYRNMMEDYCTKVGVHCTAHQLRHSFATRIVLSSLPPKVIQKILGHAQISTTMDIYAEIRENTLQDSIGVMDHMWT